MEAVFCKILRGRIIFGFLLLLSNLMNAQLWIVDPLEAIYPDKNKTSNYSNNWKADFARGLAGPIDYTPGTFDILYKKAKNRVKWNGLDDGTSRVNTTLAKQLGLFVILYSPLQMASDLIENYENQPAFKFIEDFATDWEKSEVLNGKNRRLYNHCKKR